MEFYYIIQMKDTEFRWEIEKQNKQTKNLTWENIFIETDTQIFIRCLNTSYILYLQWKLVERLHPSDF